MRSFKADPAIIATVLFERLNQLEANAKRTEPSTILG